MPPHKSTLNPISIFRREFLDSSVESLLPNDAITTSPHTPIGAALDLLAHHEIGSLLILDERRCLCGIVTERDFVKKYALGASLGPRDPVSRLMSGNPEIIKSTGSIARVFHMMAHGKYRHIPVVGGAGDSLRMISVKDLVDRIHQRLTAKILDPDHEIYFDSNSVDQFFNSCVTLFPPEIPLTLTEGEPFERALHLLGEHNKGCVVIVNDRKRPVGLFSERDYISRVARPGVTTSGKSVGELMTRSPRTVMPSTSIAMALSLLSEHGFRHLPVVDEYETLHGMISVRTVVNHLADRIVETLELAHR